jgi:hypothetical protein
VFRAFVFSWLILFVFSRPSEAGFARLEQESVSSMQLDLLVAVLNWSEG